MHAALYNITTNKVGEKLANFNLTEGDLVLADRVYGSVAGIKHCMESGAEYILRLRKNGIGFRTENGDKFDLYSHMRDKEIGECTAFAKSVDGELIPVRVCFKKKSSEAIKKTQKRLHKQETRRMVTISDEAKAFNKYIVVVTSLGSDVDCAEVLDIYRYRWQVELYFKRLKSILDYGELPKKTEESIFAWLNGKLMIALLMEKKLSRATFFPKEESYEEYLERRSL